MSWKNWTLKNNNLKYWFDKHKCDKSHLHGYEEVYEPYIDSLFHPCEVLEIGIYEGASARALLDCYSELKYYGVDIFERRNAIHISDLMNNDRFHFLVADSTTTMTAPLIESHWIDISFDMIIDDGSHLHDDITKTFLNTYKFLKKGCTYFIEDFYPNNNNNVDLKYERSVSQINYFKGNTDKFNNDTYNRLLNAIDSVSPSKVTHHDLRGGKRNIDSYIIAITK